MKVKVIVICLMIFYFLNVLLFFFFEEKKGKRRRRKNAIAKLYFCISISTVESILSHLLLLQYTQKHPLYTLNFLKLLWHLLRSRPAQAMCLERVHPSLQRLRPRRRRRRHIGFRGTRISTDRLNHYREKYNIDTIALCMRKRRRTNLPKKLRNICCFITKRIWLKTTRTSRSC